MRLRSIHATPLAALLAVALLAEPAGRLFEKKNLVAWCIVPFDAKKRGPEERAAMLERLGIRKLAYDWREKDIPTFDQELDALSRHGIEMHAFWLTSGPNPSQDKRVNAVYGFLERRKVKTQIWYMFIPPKDFDALSQDAKIEMLSGTVRYLAEKAAKLGNSVGLYNHGGWFGEPENQIAILMRLGLKNVGMVYNFHHGRHHMDRFASVFPKMAPYLMAVNINGMRSDGPMILPVGQGDRELDMLRVVEGSGYRGPIGILGHREEEDAEVALRQNLEGLERLRGARGKKAAPGS